MKPWFKLATLAAACLLGAATAQAQVVLTPLDPVLLDTSYVSDIGTPAMITFVNLEPFAVDIYWIDYSGNRVFYNALDANTSYLQGTFITHPWIAAKVGSGDTLAQGTGELLAGFLAVTANPVQDPLLADTAYIGAVPEPASWALLLAGVAAVGSLTARRRTSRA